MAAKPMPRIFTGVSGCHIIKVSSTNHHLPLSPGPSENLISSSESADGESHTTTEVTASPQLSDIPIMETTMCISNNDTSHEKQSELPQTSSTNSVSTLVSTQIKCSDLPVAMRETLNTDTSNEVQRCKELMMLQVSLISRQQDLLKLRDKEIMKLKAENQSLKCRLERMERRISLSRKHNKSPSPSSLKMNKVCSNEKHKASQLSSQFSKMESSFENEHVTKSTIHPETSIPNSQPQREHLAKSRMVPPLRNESCSDITQNDEATSANSTDVTNPPITMPSESTCFPVPVSFIERCQNQLLSTIKSSPIVTVKERGFSPSAGSESNSSRFAFKICDRCPHCIAMATEITRLLSISNNVGKVFSQSSELVKRPVSPMFRPMLNVSNISTATRDEQVESPEMRTCHRYYRQFSISSLNNYQPIDELLSENLLHIPTWRTSNFESIYSTTPPPSEIELTDDDVYCRRHSKFEIAEKRRKRWDIQRIREFRYNERLRQKLLKQERHDDALETFMPTLYDIDAVEIDETLPINAFGHCLPLMKPSEFSMRQPES